VVPPLAAAWAPIRAFRARLDFEAVIASFASGNVTAGAAHTVRGCSTRPAPDARLYRASLRSDPESQLKDYLRLLSSDWMVEVQALAGWLPVILQIAAVM